MKPSAGNIEGICVHLKSKELICTEMFEIASRRFHVCKVKQNKSCLERICISLHPITENILNRQLDDGKIQSFLIARKSFADLFHQHK